MKFWCIKHKHFSSTILRTWCYEVEANNKPTDGKVDNLFCDEYRNYFKNYEEAKKFENSLRK